MGLIRDDILLCYLSIPRRLCRGNKEPFVEEEHRLVFSLWAGFICRYRAFAPVEDWKNRSRNSRKKMSQGLKKQMSKGCSTKR